MQPYVEIECPRCDGSGIIELDGRFAIHAETLVLLQKQKRELNGTELARIAGVNPTAMDNRLVKLESLGLATSRWQGRSRLWKAIKRA